MQIYDEIIHYIIKVKAELGLFSMKISVNLRKWGNSVGLRIPATVLNSLDLAPDSQVNLTIESDRLIVEKSTELPTLNEILNSIPEDFRYPEDISDFVASESVGDELI